MFFETKSSKWPSWTADFNEEVALCEKYLQQYHKLNVQNLNKRKNELKIAHDIWEKLAGASEKESFWENAEIKREKREIDEQQAALNKMNSELEAKSVNVAYCEAIEKAANGNYVLLKEAANYNRTACSRAAYFVALFEKNVTEQVRLLENASLYAGEQIKVILRKAEVRKAYVGDNREITTNPQIVNLRNKYYQEAEALFSQLASGIWEIQARAEIQELNSWKLSWERRTVSRTGSTTTSVGTSQVGRTMLLTRESFWQKGIQYTKKHPLKACAMGVAVCAVLVFGPIVATIPSRVSDAWESSLEDKRNLTETVSKDGKKSRAKYTVNNGVIEGVSDNRTSTLVFPTEVKGEKITGIWWNNYELFETNGEEITEIVIPEGITTLGGFRFSELKSLKKVTLPKSLKMIGEDVFAGCTELEEIQFGNGLASVGENAFTNTKWYSQQVMEKGYVLAGNALLALDPLADLEDMLFPKGTTCVGAKVFEGNEEITEIVFPKGFLGVSDFAFNDCKNLQSVTFPEGMLRIGEDAFAFCESLNQINFEGSVQRILPRAFEGAWQGAVIEKLILPEGLEMIGEGAFDNREIKQLILPEKSLQTVGQNAFETIGNMKDENGLKMVGSLLVSGKEVSGNVEIPKGITALADYCFEGNSQIKSITIPEGITYLGQNIFANCQSLQRVILPKSLTTIGEGTFSYCTSLVGIELPKNLTSIGKNAFGGCEALTVIEGGKNLQNVDEYAFDMDHIPEEWKEKLEKIWGKQ